MLGNHEYYAGAVRWIAHYEAMGLRVLLNAHATVARGGSRIVVGEGSRAAAACGST